MKQQAFNRLGYMILQKLAVLKTDLYCQFRVIANKIY